MASVLVTSWYTDKAPWTLPTALWKSKVKLKILKAWHYATTQVFYIFLIEISICTKVIWTIGSHILKNDCVPSVNGWEGSAKHCFSLHGHRKALCTAPTRARHTPSSASTMLLIHSFYVAHSATPIFIFWTKLPLITKTWRPPII